MKPPRIQVTKPIKVAQKKRKQETKNKQILTNFFKEPLPFQKGQRLKDLLFSGPAPTKRLHLSEKDSPVTDADIDTPLLAEIPEDRYGQSAMMLNETPQTVAYE